MKWYNEPSEWREEPNGTIHVTTTPATDFWRKTHYGFIRDNGHFYYQPMPGDFIAEVKVSGNYIDLYDQAGLMVRVDEANWLKCGIEYVEGVQQVSAVVTREYSDWSVVPLPQNPSSLYLRVTRQGEAVQVDYSLDGQSYSLLRMAYLVATEITQAGVMCASPDGKGFSVTFEGFNIRQLADEAKSH